MGNYFVDSSFLGGFVGKELKQIQAAANIIKTNRCYSLNAALGDCIEEGKQGEKR